MEKKKMDRRFYDQFQKELEKQQEEGRISEEQLKDILSSYEVAEKINFIKILVTIGSILIGLGVLSMIASNWAFMGKAVKLSIILFSYIAVNGAAFRMEGKYPKTSRSLIYLGMLIFGAGIFLIGQMFHFGGRFTSAFLLWAVGIFPLTVLLRDKWAYVFLHVLLLVYLDGQYVYDDYPFFLILIIPLLYYVQKRFKSNLTIFFTNIVTLNFIWYSLDQGLQMDEDILFLIFFVIGLLMYVAPISYYRSIFQLQGNLVFGVMGLILTDYHAWNDYKWLENVDMPINIIFALLYMVLLLILARKENLIALLFLGLTILRFYFDQMYDFLPKSLFFLTGGLILLGFGYYFERKRKQLKEENR